MVGWARFIPRGKSSQFELSHIKKFSIHFVITVLISIRACATIDKYFLSLGMIRIGVVSVLDCDQESERMRTAE